MSIVLPLGLAGRTDLSNTHLLPIRDVHAGVRKLWDMVHGMQGQSPGSDLHRRNRTWWQHKDLEDHRTAKRQGAHRRGLENEALRLQLRALVR
jgi:hypothetical protein